jgi:hypothetical protein
MIKAPGNAFDNEDVLLLEVITPVTNDNSVSFYILSICQGPVVADYPITKEDQMQYVSRYLENNKSQHYLTLNRAYNCFKFDEPLKIEISTSLQNTGNYESVLNQLLTQIS